MCWFISVYGFSERYCKSVIPTSSVSSNISLNAFNPFSCTISWSNWCSESDEKIRWSENALSTWRVFSHALTFFAFFLPYVMYLVKIKERALHCILSYLLPTFPMRTLFDIPLPDSTEKVSTNPTKKTSCCWMHLFELLCNLDLLF